MNGITNATPRPLLLGTQDNSTAQLPVEPELIPTHLPFIPIFAERGTTEPQIASGAALQKTWGANTFDFKQPFAKHQTVLANIVNAAGNAVMIKRLQPAGAATAMLRLSLEIVTNVTTPVYVRDANTGQYVLDASGNLQPLLDNLSNPVTVSGVLYVWHLNFAGTSADAFGEAQTQQLLLPRVTGTQSTVYPIADFEVGTFGSYGNRVGLRLTAPTALSSTPSDLVLAQSLQQFIYRFQLVELGVNSVTPLITPTIDGELSMDLVLAADTTDANGTDVSLDTALVDAYSDDNPVNGPKVIGPFGRVHVYHTNVTTVQTALFNAEAAALSSGPHAGAAWIPVDYTDSTNKGLMNILNGLDFNGVPYEAIRSQTVADADMISFNSNFIGVNYAAGGADGDLSDASYDQLVADYMGAFGSYVEPDGKFWPTLDMLRYPMSIIYDTGFSPDTKKKLITPIGLRKDVGVILGTHYAGQWATISSVRTYVPNTAQLTVTQEQSMAVALRTALQAYPESDAYGTGVLRGAVIGHSGHLMNSGYKGYLPLTLEVASKLAAYMGAGTGIWNNRLKPDVNPNNKVTLFKNVNNTWQSDSSYSKDWSLGLNWVQSCDTKTLFFPAYHTAYGNDTSVLTSLITMLAVIDLEKVAVRTWTVLTGRSDLTNAQLIEKSNKNIADAVKGKYDGRYVIVPQSYVSRADEARGYSWSVNINLYADNMKTVAAFTITANRMSALSTTSA